MTPEISTLFFTPLSYSKRAGCHVGESILHYESEGWRQGLNPHPMFDTVYFMNKYGEGDTSKSPFEIYKRVRRNAFPSTTPFFQMEYYLRNNEDVVSAGVSPVEHYVSVGVAEARQPNPWYLLQRPSIPPGDFWDRAVTLDGYLNELDTLRLVNVAWLSEAMNFPMASAHSMFWHNRYGRPDLWPMSPESMLGSIHPQNFRCLDEFSAALEILITGPSGPAQP